MENNNLYLQTARFYDLESWHQDMLAEEIPFCRRYLRPGEGPVLELASGTGRVAIALAELGHPVVALDLSATMLEEFAQRRARLPEAVQQRLTSVLADMSDFNLGRRFPLILVLLRSFQCLLTEAQQRNCLRSVLRHLEPGGAFILAVFKGTDDMPATWNYRDRTRTLHDPETNHQIIKRHSARVDTAKQVVKFDLTYTVTAADGSRAETNEPFSLMYLLPNQLRRLLESEGFHIEDEFGNYDLRPVVAGDEMIVVCRRAADVPALTRLFNWRRLRRFRIVWLVERALRKLGRVVGGS